MVHTWEVAARLGCSSKLLLSGLLFMNENPLLLADALQALMDTDGNGRISSQELLATAKRFA